MAHHAHNVQMLKTKSKRKSFDSNQKWVKIQLFSL